jgi:hypothetical protein
MSKIKWLNRTLIKLHYKLVLCTSEENYYAILTQIKVPKREWGEWLAKDSNAMTNVFNEEKIGNKRAIIVCIKPNLKNAEAHLDHEAVHVFQYEMKFIQEEKPSDEFMAYSIAAIKETLIRAYKK